MSNLPKTLEIAGKTWKVKSVKGLSHDGIDCDGLCQEVQRTISVNPDAPQQQETLLHEVLHAIFAECGTAHLLNPDLEHALIDNLERHLIPLLPAIAKVKNKSKK